MDLDMDMHREAAFVLNRRVLEEERENQRRGGERGGRPRRNVDWDISLMTSLCYAVVTVCLTVTGLVYGCQILRMMGLCVDPVTKDVQPALLKALLEGPRLECVHPKANVKMLNSEKWDKLEQSKHTAYILNDNVEALETFMKAIKFNKDIACSRMDAPKQDYQKKLSSSPLNGPFKLGPRPL